VEGTAINNIDVFAESGGLNTALIKSAIVNVTDGQLNITFAASVNQAEINGIQIVPVGTAPTATPTNTLGASATRTATATSIPTNTATATVTATRTSTATVTNPPNPSAIRIEAGGAANFTDSSGNLWLAESGFTGGGIVDRGNIAIGNTVDDRIYQTEHYGMTAFAYNLPNGSYQVNLHFAETYTGITAAGQRVFSANVEGIAINNIDVFAQSGGLNNALIKTANVNVTDGQLNITFAATVNNPEINGIEIIPGTLAPTATPTMTPNRPTVRVEAGGAANFVDASGNTWIADTGFTAGAGGVVDRGAITIGNTVNDRIYQTERWGMTAFAYPVTNGAYQVNLHFAETYTGITAAGQRVFSANVEGTAINNIDVFAQAGGLNNALVKSACVNVADGQLSIAFAATVNNPEINGVEIIPVASCP
jgi:fibrillarin-like rRNA methylase